MESVPEDAAALIICSPQKDFSSEETEKILIICKIAEKYYYLQIIQWMKWKIWDVYWKITD